MKTMKSVVDHIGLKGHQEKVAQKTQPSQPVAADVSDNGQSSDCDSNSSDHPPNKIDPFKMMDYSEENDGVQDHVSCTGSEGFGSLFDDHRSVNSEDDLPPRQDEDLDALLDKLFRDNATDEGLDTPDVDDSEAPDLGLAEGLGQGGQRGPSGCYPFKKIEVSLPGITLTIVETA